MNIGSSSATQIVAITNTGGAAVTFSSIAISGTNATSFTDTQNCGATLAVGASCNIVVTFTPVATGTLTANLVLTDNVSGSPQAISLNGTGVGVPAVSLNQTTLNFPPTGTGATSAALTVTLTNSGTANVVLTSVAVAGSTAFVATNTCGTVAPNATCMASVVFKPTITGAQTAGLVFTDNVTGSPQTVTLNGTGITGTVQLPPPPTQAALLYGTVVTGTSQPVAGASVKLYAIREGPSAPTAALASTTTGTDGSFYFYKTGATSFTCPSAANPVYLIASGGTPQGVASANSALVMMTMLGSCGSLTTAVINEATTVAGVSAMYNFIGSASSIVSSTNNIPSLLTAAATALQLIDPTTGNIPGPALPAGATVDVAKIYALADFLYSCTHSAGGVSGDGSACATLFANTTSIPQVTPNTVPTETFTATLNILTFLTPWIKGFENAVPSTGAPFAPIWTTPPTDLIPRVLPQVAAPVLSPAPGTYTGGTATITMTSATSGAQIYYTTDGSTPTTSSTPYLGPLNLQTTSAVTLSAIAVENVSTNSTVTTGTYFVSGPHFTVSVPAQPLAATTSANATGTVTLSAATTAATTVTLTSGSPNAVSFALTATPTTTVTIPAGQTSANFTVYGISAGNATVTATATNVGLGSTQVRSTMLTSTNTVTTAKQKIIGFTAMGYQGFVDSGILVGTGNSVTDTAQEEISADPNLFTGAVINVVWSQLEPAQGSYDFSVIEQNIASIVAANAKYNQHVRGKIRVFGNANVPQWLLAQENGGVSVQNGAGGEQFDALYWSAHYEAHFVALMNALAAEYDSRDIMAEMDASACASNTDEPEIETQTTIAIGYTDPNTNITYPSMHALGYTDGKMETCEEHQEQDYAAWKLTPLYLPFSAWRTTDTTTPANTTPQYLYRDGFTLELMHAWFDQLGARGILGNQALDDEVDKEAEQDEIETYTEFALLHAMGASVGMQTVGQGAISAGPGTPVCVNPGTGDDGVCYNGVIAYGIKQGGQEIELWQTTNAAEPNGPNGFPKTGNAQISAADIAAWNLQYGFKP